MKSTIFTFALSFMALLATTYASVVNVTLRDSGSSKDVFNPQIYAPTQGTVWTIGTQQAVEWDTANAPYEVTNTLGKIVLAQNWQMFTDESGGLDNPLACDFSIFDGVAYITVPYVTPGYDYQIVLFGDSGNFSPTFTISY